MPSPLDVSKRALVALLRSLGLAFGCPVTVTRDSSEQQVKGAFRSVARKVHPDKPGGSQEDSNISLLNYLTDCTVCEAIHVG